MPPLVIITMEAVQKPSGYSWLARGLRITPLKGYQQQNLPTKDTQRRIPSLTSSELSELPTNGTPHPRTHVTQGLAAVCSHHLHH
jgi:hypothetical protein